MKQKIRFIINPKSGTGKQRELESLIKKKFPASGFDIEIVLTQSAEHLAELSREAADKDYWALAVSGGDGTVHEAVQALCGKKTALAVIPTGSGNGFANHFNIPHDPLKALDVILQQKIISIDSLKVNNKICAATTGVGFDAHIANLFATFGTRGFSSYIRLVIREFFSYKEREYTFTCDGKTFSRQAFLVTLANTSQFGNNTSIAPLANAQDGLLDVCILRKIPLLQIPFTAPRLFNRSLHHSSFYETFQCKKVRIIISPTQAIHIDGEPVVAQNEINAEVIPRSLNLLVP